MGSWADERRHMDQEDRATEALAALDCLQELLSGQCRDATVKAEPLAYMLKVVIYSVNDAMPDGRPKHRAPVNDIDLP